MGSLLEVSYLGSHLDSPNQQIHYFLITGTMYVVMYFTALEKEDACAKKGEMGAVGAGLSGG